MLYTDRTSNVSCTRPAHGAIYAAHGAEDNIDLSKAPVLQAGSAFRAFIYPIVIETDQSVCFIHVSFLFAPAHYLLFIIFFQFRALPFSTRKCWLEHEHPLKLTSVYTMMTCIADCRVRNYIALCNCIPYYYPHLGSRN